MSGVPAWAKAWLVAATLALATGLFASVQVERAAGADQAVAIVDYRFEPATVMIDAGDTVTWTVTHAQDPHTVTPVDPPDAFAGSGLLREGDTFAVTFRDPGVYRYQCTIHPEQMQGTVTVVGAARSVSPTSSATAPISSAVPTASPLASSPGPFPAPSPTAASTSTGSAGAPSAAILIAVSIAVLAAGGLAAWILVARRRA
jgi:plastocyanin